MKIEDCEIGLIVRSIHNSRCKYRITKISVNMVTIREVISGRGFRNTRPEILEPC